MIGRLRGKILSKSADGAVIDVHGVGYDVWLPLGTLATQPPEGQETSLFIHTHVREDELRLFGFATDQDRAAFRTMLKVGGVGPKLALMVIGALSGPDLARIVEDGDSKRLTAIPGIGKKTAERIILELGGKLDLGTGAAKTGAPVGVLGELGSALKNLGFKPAEVERVLASLEQDGGSERPFEELLRDGLGLLQKSK